MTRRTIVFALLALLLTALESVAMFVFGIRGSGLYLSMGILFFAAANTGDIEGALIAAVIGYGWDLFSGLPTGLSIAPAIVIFVAVRMLSVGFVIGGVFQMAFFGFVASLFHSLANAGYIVFAGTRGDVVFLQYMSSVIPQAGFAALCAPAVFWTTKLLDDLFVDDRNELGVW